jgi:hypothetical protein
MPRTLLMLPAALVLAASLAAATPDWVLSGGADTGYALQLYLTGYGISPLEGRNANNAQQAAKDLALKDLGQRLKVSIDASSRISDTSSGNQSFSSYQSDVKAMVNLDLAGVEKYEAAFDPTLNRWVALAVLNKASMLAMLQTGRSAAVAQLESDLKEVQGLLGRQRPDLLQKSLLTFDRHLDALVQNVALAKTLGEGSDGNSVLQKFYSSRDEARGQALSGQILTSKDLVKALASAFAWNDLAGVSLLIVPAVYRTSDISGEFFYHLGEDLGDALQLQVKGLILVDGAPERQPEFTLRGSYYEAGEGWHVVFKLSNLRSGELVGTWDTELEAEFVKAQKYAFVPENLGVAASDHDLQSALYAQPVRTELKVWTNKGSEGVVFVEGEYVTFTVMVNRPGYLSVLYHLAGSQRRRTPLVENLNVYAKDVGKPFALDRMGPFTAPFGSEAVQVFYSPEPMVPYQTREATIDGVKFSVLSEDYDQLLLRSRGLGGLGKSAATPSEQWKTDTTLAITTIPRSP